MKKFFLLCGLIPFFVSSMQKENQKLDISFEQINQDVQNNKVINIQEKDIASKFDKLYLKWSTYRQSTNSQKLVFDFASDLFDVLDVTDVFNNAEKIKVKNELTIYKNCDFFKDLRQYKNDSLVKSVTKIVETAKTSGIKKSRLAKLGGIILFARIQSFKSIETYEDLKKVLNSELFFGPKIVTSLQTIGFKADLACLIKLNCKRAFEDKQAFDTLRKNMEQTNIAYNIDSAMKIEKSGGANDEQHIRDFK